MKLFRVVLIFALLCILFTGNLNAQSKTYYWRIGHSNVEGSTRDIAAHVFKEVIERETNGKVKVDVFPMSVLGTEQEMLESLHMGSLELQIAGCGSYVNYVPEVVAFNLPFLFNDYEEANALLDGPAGDLYKEVAAKKGFEILSFTDLGFTQITNNVRPINHPDDLNGIKMRCPNEPHLVACIRQLGAKPSTMAYSELYLGLSQGVVDGQFNPISSIYESKFYEVQDYLSFVNMLYYYCGITMNKDLYDSLETDLQEVVQKAAYEATVASRKHFQKIEGEALDKMRSNFKEISYPDVELFRNKIAPVYKEYEKIAGKDIVEKLLEIVKEYRK